MVNNIYPDSHLHITQIRTSSPQRWLNGETASQMLFHHWANVVTRIFYFRVQPAFLRKGKHEWLAGHHPYSYTWNKPLTPDEVGGCKYNIDVPPPRGVSVPLLYALYWYMESVHGIELTQELLCYLALYWRNYNILLSVFTRGVKEKNIRHFFKLIMWISKNIIVVALLYAVIEKVHYDDRQQHKINTMCV